MLSQPRQDATSKHAEETNQTQVAKPAETKQNTSSPVFDPSKTAKPVAAMQVGTASEFWIRRNRGDRTTPLTRGNHGLLFVTQDEVEAIYKRGDVHLIQSVGIRARWINKVYEFCIKQQGIKQVIILGSGYDVRPYKKNAANQAAKENPKNAGKYAEVRFFEVDKAVILDEKEKIFNQKKLDKNAVYIRADYTEAGFIEKLRASGVDCDAPTVFIWEGNTMYLEKEQLASMMKTLKSTFPLFVLTFDYFTQTMLDQLKTGIWKTGIDDIHAFAREHELVLMDNRKIADLALEYKVDREPNPVWQQYSVCSLSSGPR